ncbi:hypothetical protein Glove_543g71 [Diversispora epigaea]|uniref:Uncharacterized protein n=1 Tax=Diversispora epigaea TaxID=1348612 RepID=A0A397GE21_9GLOM|nr:hypothetical protein Glove_543g71 [Diversispora epigaea]
MQKGRNTKRKETEVKGGNKKMNDKNIRKQQEEKIKRTLGIEGKETKRTGTELVHLRKIDKEMQRNFMKGSKQKLEFKTRTKESTLKIKILAKEVEKVELIEKTVYKDLEYCRKLNETYREQILKIFPNFKKNNNTGNLIIKRTSG